MNLFAGSFLLILVMFAELVILKYIRKDQIPWREVVYNVNSGHILMWIFRALEVLMFIYVLNNFSFHLLSGWHFVAQWIFTFVAWDFCFYWLHRMHHKIPLFWLIHVVHHEGQHFSLSLGLRNSWYSSLSSIPFFLMLAVIGVPVEVFISVSAVHYFVQFYNHNGVVGKSGILKYFMVTPARHRVHHGMNPEYVDTNFGGTLGIWDQMFGTYQPEIEGVPIQYGVDYGMPTENPLLGNNLPFMKAMGGKLPTLKKFSENKFNVSDMFIASGGLALLNLWLFYIFCEGKGLGMQQFYLFMIIFLGTVALGALSDGELWGMIGWVLITTIPSAVFIVHYQIYNSWLPLLLFAIFFLHGMYGLFGIKRASELRESSV